MKRNVILAILFMSASVMAADKQERFAIMKRFAIATGKKEDTDRILAAALAKDPSMSPECTYYQQLCEGDNASVGVRDYNIADEPSEALPNQKWWSIFSMCFGK